METIDDRRTNVINRLLKRRRDDDTDDDPDARRVRPRTLGSPGLAPGPDDDNVMMDAVPVPVPVPDPIIFGVKRALEEDTRKVKRARNVTESAPFEWPAFRASARYTQICRLLGLDPVTVGTPPPAAPRQAESSRAEEELDENDLMNRLARLFVSHRETPLSLVEHLVLIGMALGPDALVASGIDENDFHLRRRLCQFLIDSTGVPVVELTRLAAAVDPRTLGLLSKDDVCRIFGSVFDQAEAARVLNYEAFLASLSPSERFFFDLAMLGIDERRLLVAVLVGSDARVPVVLGNALIAATRVDEKNGGTITMGFLHWARVWKLARLMSEGETTLPSGPTTTTTTTPEEAVRTLQTACREIFPAEACTRLFSPNAHEQSPPYFSPNEVHEMTFFIDEASALTTDTDRALGLLMAVFERVRTALLGFGPDAAACLYLAACASLPLATDVESARVLALMRLCDPSLLPPLRVISSMSDILYDTPLLIALNLMRGRVHHWQPSADTYRLLLLFPTVPGVSNLLFSAPWLQTPDIAPDALFLIRRVHARAEDRTDISRALLNRLLKVPGPVVLGAGTDIADIIRASPRLTDVLNNLKCLQLLDTLRFSFPPELEDQLAGLFARTDSSAVLYCMLLALAPMCHDSRRIHAFLRSLSVPLDWLYLRSDGFTVLLNIMDRFVKPPGSGTRKFVPLKHLGPQNEQRVGVLAFLTAVFGRQSMPFGIALENTLRLPAHQLLVAYNVHAEYAQDSQFAAWDLLRMIQRLGGKSDPMFESITLTTALTVLRPGPARMTPTSLVPALMGWPSCDVVSGGDVSLLTIFMDRLMTQLNDAPLDDMKALRTGILASLAPASMRPVQGQFRLALFVPLLIAVLKGSIADNTQHPVMLVASKVFCTMIEAIGSGTYLELVAAAVAAGEKAPFYFSHLPPDILAQFRQLAKLPLVFTPGTFAPLVFYLELQPARFIPASLLAPELGGDDNGLRLARAAATFYARNAQV